MLLVQISDTHLVAAGPRRAARLAALRQAVSFISALDPPPAAVIHTGDLTHNARPEQYALARSCLADLRVPLVAVPGNRDRRHSFKAAAPPPSEMAGPQFVQFALELGRARIIALDTLEEGLGLGSFCEQRFAEPSAMLARGDGKPTVVALHHPPLSLPSVPGGAHFHDEATAHRLAVQLARDPSIIGVLAGHVHRRATAALGRATVETIPSLAVDLRKGIHMGRQQEGRPVVLLHEVGPRGLATRAVALDPV
jgi:3',5'-cyclic-AMP phosphodiesterase